MNERESMQSLQVMNNNLIQIKLKEQSIMQEAEFILRNLFIIHPHKLSSYKLRIIINHEESQQKISSSSLKYKFRFAINDKILAQPYGCICLLEKVFSNQFQTVNYLEIGKGELDFNEILNNSKDQQSLNGVIYGTRATNFDKIIAKYSYNIIKRALQPKKVSFLKNEGTSINKIKFKDHKQKQKLPTLQFKQSIIDRNNDINAKIKKLSESLLEENEETLSLRKNSFKPSLKRIEGIQVKTQPESNPKKVVKEQIPSANTMKKQKEKHHYYYKLNEKIEKLIIQQNFNEIKWIQIKNIQIFKYQSLSQQLQRQQMTNPYDNDLILLKIFQGSSLKLCEVVIKLIFNANNRFVDLFLPIPQGLQSIKLQLIFLKYNIEVLHGQTRVISSINKTIQLYNVENEQKGFISLEILKSNTTSINYETYKSQITQFNQASIQFPLVIRKEPSLNVLKNNSFVTSPLGDPKEFAPTVDVSSKRNSRLQNHSHMKKRVITQFSNNYGKRNDILQKIVPKTLKQSRYEGRKDFPQNNRSVNSQYQQNTPNNVISPMLSSLYIKIKNIYIHLYEQDPNLSLILKFDINGKVQVKEVLSGYNNLDSLQESLILDDLQPLDFIKISFSSSSKGKQKSIGKCMLTINDLIKSTGNQFKIFIKKSSFLIGFIILQASLYRIKNNNVKRFSKPVSLPHRSLKVQEEYQIEISSDNLGYQNRLYQEEQSSVKASSNHSLLLQQQNYQ